MPKIKTHRGAAKPIAAGPVAQAMLALELRRGAGQVLVEPDPEAIEVAAVDALQPARQLVGQFVVGESTFLHQGER